MNPFRPAAARALAAALMTGSVQMAVAADHFYDGSERRSITRQTDLLAEFKQDSGPRSVRATVAGAVPLAGVGDSLVRIYRVPRAAVRAGDAKAPPSGSVVYREGDSPAGRLLALPGGVMVKFKPDWTPERIGAWVASRGLAVERKLAIGSNWYLVTTPAGDASLTTANTIFESGEVLAAVPNWWKQTVPR